MGSDSRSSEILSKVQVAKPCPANWREMHGNDRVRHCTHCSRNVYNISALSRKQAADLIEKSEGRVCIRYYTRPDGGIMTRDCGEPIPVPLQIPKFLAALLAIFLPSPAATAILGTLGLSAVASWMHQRATDSEVMGSVAVGKAYVGEPVMGAPIAPQETMGKPAISNNSRT